MSEVRQVSMSVGGCIAGHRWAEVLTYPFCYSDGGRQASKRPRQKNDCTVRALAIACDLEYDAAYDLLAAAGRQCSRGFDFKKWAEGRLVHGYRLSWQFFQANKGQRRMNPDRFCREFSAGRYILRVAKHVCAVVDGVLLDTFEQPPDRCIYGCWRVGKE